jgi:hypothetical protein
MHAAASRPASILGDLSTDHRGRAVPVQLKLHALLALYAPDFEKYSTKENEKK